MDPSWSGYTKDVTCSQTLNSSPQTPGTCSPGTHTMIIVVYVPEWDKPSIWNNEGCFDAYEALTAVCNKHFNKQKFSSENYL